MVPQRPTVAKETAELPLMVLEKCLIPSVRVEVAGYLELCDLIVRLGSCSNCLIHHAEHRFLPTCLGCNCRSAGFNDLFLTYESVAGSRLMDSAVAPRMVDGGMLGKAGCFGCHVGLSMTVVLALTRSPCAGHFCAIAQRVHCWVDTEVHPE